MARTNVATAKSLVARLVMRLESFQNDLLGLDDNCFLDPERARLLLEISGAMDKLEKTHVEVSGVARKSRKPNNTSWKGSKCNRMDINEIAGIPRNMARQPNELYHRDMLTDNDLARKYFESIRWPNGPRCLDCESSSVSFQAGTGAWQCSRCRNSFNVRTGTMMYRSKLNYAHWARIINESNKPLIDLDIIRISSELGVAIGIVQSAVDIVKSGAMPPWLEKAAEEIMRL